MAVCVGVVVGSLVIPSTSTAYDAFSTRHAIMLVDIVYDSGRGLVYASVDSGDLNHPNAVVEIDPDTGEVLASHAIGTLPGELAMSAAGDALYVGVDGQGVVKRLSLPTFTETWSYAMERYHGYVVVAGDIAPMPGVADTIAVTLSTGDATSPNGVGLVILDAGVERPNSLELLVSDPSITFGDDASHLLVAETGVHPGSMFRWPVDSNGIATGTGQPGPGGSQVESHDGLAYLAHGGIVDVTGPDMTLVDTLEGGSSVAIDSAGQAIYYTRWGPPGVAWIAIVGYDLVTRVPIGTWEVKQNVGVASELTIVGDRRAAYIESQFRARSGQLVLVDLRPLEEALGSSGEYTSLTPTRILDTRTGLGNSAGSTPIGADRTSNVQITGTAGVPNAGVSAVVLNVTATQPTHHGFLTVYPAGIDRPTISSLNFAPGQTVANLVTVPVGIGGKVSVYNPYGATHVVFDVAGYYATVDGPAGSRFHPMAPARVMDTRTGTGGFLGSIDADSSLPLDLSKHVPCCATSAVVMNVTVTNTTAPSFLTVYPSDVPLPVVSNLNYGPGTTRANQVIVRLPADGIVSFYNLAGTTDIVVDLVGFYDDAQVGGRFVPFEPFRAVDTRVHSPFPHPGDLWSGDTLFLGDPSESLSAYALNVTVTGTVGNGFVTAYPYSSEAPDPPLASTLNYVDGSGTVANHALVKTGPYLGFFNFGGKVHLIVDVFGGFT